MRISLKNITKLNEAVGDAFFADLRENDADLLEHCPDTWSSSEKERFDRLSEIEYNIKKRMEAIFQS